MQDIYFNGKHLYDLGAVISEAPKFPAAVPEMELVAMPYKSGDLIIDKKRFKNIQQTYKVTYIPTFGDYTESQFVAALADWLLSARDYAVLRDTEIPGYFRRAVCTGIGSPKSDISGVVTTTLAFSLDPFLYSDAGTTPLTRESSDGDLRFSLYNPFLWAAEPIIKLYGSGNFSLSVGEYAMSITDADTLFTVDTPSEDVYDKNGAPANDKLSGIAMPTLKPGENLITATCMNGGELADFTMEITPNWRRI